jgi:glyoxylase I family protein
MIPISFHHVSVSVTDLSRSRAFYEGLGFRPVVHWQDPDGQLQILHLALGSLIVELFSYTTPTVPSQLALEQDLRTIGLRHFALRVDSVASAREALLSTGYRMETEIRRGRTGIDYFFIRDPDGVFVEFVEDHRVFS